MHINSTTEFFSSWNFLSSALRNIRIRSNWEISVLPGFVVFVVRHDCCVANSTTNCKIEKQNLIRLSLFSQIHIYFYYWSHWRASKSAHKIVVNNRSRVLAIFRFWHPYWGLHQALYSLTTTTAFMEFIGKIERKRVVRIVSSISRMASGDIKMIMVNRVMARARLFMIRVLG